VYDYAQPLNVDAPPPSQQVAQSSVEVFDQARGAFQAGDYPQALQLTDAALAKLPNDPAMHEFRALVLFALGRYDQAAAVLYSVLAVSPGWDWATMAGLYTDINTYTTQLRALEAYVSTRPDSASGHFVLGYHYLTAGHEDAAVRELKEVVRIKPSDRLSQAILAQLSPQSAPSTTTPPADPSPPAAPTAVAADLTPGDLTGSWKAQPAEGTTIALAIGSDNKFTWSVTEKGKTQSFGGATTFANGILTLAREDDAGALVGKVSSPGPGQFTFRLLGGPPGDPGLAFRKS
jgi:tetratricopeptide (TPR) repeat protein